MSGCIICDKGETGICPACIEVLYANRRFYCWYCGTIACKSCNGCRQTQIEEEKKDDKRLLAIFFPHLFGKYATKSK